VKVPHQPLNPYTQKYKVCYFWHINAGIQHVYGDGNVGSSIFLGEIIDKSLRVFGLVIDNASELASVMGVVVIKSLLDKNCMIVVPSKNNSFRQSIATVDLIAVLH
jgi:hypothetical protein